MRHEDQTSHHSPLTSDERTPLRSTAFFGQGGVAGFLHRAFTRSMGFDAEDMQRPLIGICNTYSELNNCHRNLKEVAEAVKRGVWQAGGFPLEFPTISLGEVYLSPTSMLYRNLAAMDTEEMIRAQPLDGVVLLVNCDKTIPAALMGAASADVPAILVSGGPMLNGRHKDQVLGACTDCRRLTAELHAGQLDPTEYAEIEEGIARSTGHCMVMGTASTLNCLTEALGITLPGNGVIPAPDSRRLLLAEAAGRRIVALARECVRPSQILTREAFHNAIVLFHALGGSTNAVVHLPAIAGRLGIPLPLSLFEEIGVRTPVLANMRPSGQYQMEELFYAGGTSAVLRELLPLLHADAQTVTGKTLAANVENARIDNAEVIRTFANPLAPEGGLAILHGNLAPDGAVIKYHAATPGLLRHRGRAIVFEGLTDINARLNDPDLDVTPEDVLILRGVGPVGGPGMPEVGNFPIPDKLLKQGVRDMVRLSDARMSGTGFGTVVLHIAPESAIGGPLALVRDGDDVELDVPARKLHLDVPDKELIRRRALWQPPAPAYDRGYGKLYIQHVTQAPSGCDFDFLAGGTPVTSIEQPKF